MSFTLDSIQTRPLNKTPVLKDLRNQISQERSSFLGLRLSILVDYKEIFDFKTGLLL